MRRIGHKKMAGIAISVLSLMLLALAPSLTFGQAPAPKQKKVKDQGEYDVYNAAVKEKDPAKKLQYLNQWTEKYPDTDFKEERLQLYDQVNQPAKVMELGEKLLETEPNSLVALTLVAGNVQKLPNPSADQMAAAGKASQSLLDNLDSLKPAGTADAAWQQVRPRLVDLAKGTQLWIAGKPGEDALAKKDYPAAEQAFTKALQQYPDNAQFAYKLGSTLVSARDPNKFPQAIYEIARAVATDPAKGGLPAATHKQVEDYLNRIYTQYHGADDAGLQQLKQLALASPLPPAGFTLKTAAQIAQEKQQQFEQSNPELALWMKIKGQLVDTNGEQYFTDQLNNSAVPQLRGTLLEAKPECRPKELVVAVPLPDAQKPLPPEITLKLDMPLSGKPDLNSEFRWEGVPSAFAKDPFMLTMTVEKDKIQGLNMTPCTPPRARARRRASAPK